MFSTSIQNAEKSSWETSGIGIWTDDYANVDSAWRDRLAELADISELEENWNGEGATPPSYEMCESAYRLMQNLVAIMPAPSRVVPTPDGAIVIEWQAGERYVECEITKPFVAEWFVQNPDGDTEMWDTTWRQTDARFSWTNEWPPLDRPGTSVADDYLWEQYHAA